MLVTQVNKGTEEWGLEDQLLSGVEEGGNNMCPQGYELNWVNSLHWLVIGKIFPLF